MTNNGYRTLHNTDLYMNEMIDTLASVATNKAIRRIE